MELRSGCLFCYSVGCGRPVRCGNDSSSISCTYMPLSFIGYLEEHCFLTYAHRSRWSIGHQRPLAIALCSGPVGPLLFQLCFSVSPPTVARPASLPLPLRVPGQGLACGAGCLFYITGIPLFFIVAISRVFPVVLFCFHLFLCKFIYSYIVAKKKKHCCCRNASSAAWSAIASASPFTHFLICLSVIEC